MTGFIGGLTAGLICAIVGVWATWFFASRIRKQDAEGAEAQLAKTRKELSEAREEIARRKAASSRQKSSTDASDPQLPGLQKQLADAQQKIAVLETEAQQRTATLQSANDQLAGTEQQLAQAQRRIAELETETGQKSEAQRRIADVQTEAQQKIALLQSDLQQHIKAAENAESQLAAMRQQLADAQAQIAAAEADAQRRIARLEADAQQCMRVAETAESERKLVEKELANSEAVIARLQAEAVQTPAPANHVPNLSAQEDKSEPLLANIQQRLTQAQLRISQLEVDAELTTAKLEEERKRWQALEGFAPRIVMAGAPPNNQFITVTDSAEFRVVAMDYLAADGSSIASHAVDRSGRSVQIPIDESRVTEVQNQVSTPAEGSFPMSFRIHVEVNGMTKAFLLPVTVAVNSAMKLEPMPLGIPLKDKKEASA